VVRRSAIGPDPAQQTLIGMTDAAPTLQAWAPEQWPVCPDWQALVDAFWVSQAGLRLAGFIRERLSSGAVIYPAQPLRALALTPFESVKVVILGQDPYHGPRQAQGLAFAVAEGMPVPPSLRNILRERARDLGPQAGPGPGGRLDLWAEQGVLLLNSVLTVEQARPASHTGKGWEVLTSIIVHALMDRASPTAFMAWGAQAQALVAQLPARHLLLAANHPSPLSAARPPKPFVGCGHFSLANDWLRSQGRDPIRW
jgi:uracil-DNA glycosylase